MRYFSILFFLTFLFFACQHSTCQGSIFKHGQSEYQILLSKELDSLSREAAEELQCYLFKITKHEFEIVKEEKPGHNYLVIGDMNFPEADARINSGGLDDDVYYIGTDKQNIYLSGSGGKTQCYAVYTFLEEYLGCRYLNPGEEFVPEKDWIELEIHNKVYRPTFSFRRALFPARADEKYRLWHRLEELDEWGMFVHTFQHLVSPEKYFDEHPEYFSLVNGRRLRDGQLCLSNTEVLNLLAKNLGEKIAERPELKIWSVSQNDCYNYCECNACKALYEQYDSYSGAYLRMANYLAELFPEKIISTLAYQFTRAAPKNIAARENVNIMFCSIECNRSMPLADDPRSLSFVKDLKDWSSLTEHIFMWDYVVQFKNYLCPFPNFHVLQPNIRLFREQGIDMMFQQGSGSNWSDLSELKQYYIAKLLWNPDLDGDSLIREFIHFYYGDAAPWIKEYFDLTHGKLIENQEREFLNIYGYPTDYRDSYLSPELLHRYKSIMDEAEKKVVNDEKVLSRVQRARLAVDFAYLDVALNAPSPELCFIKNDTLDRGMMAYLDRFVELSEKTLTPYINERAFKVEDYREYVAIKLDRMLKHNLAKEASIHLKTSGSEKYPVGGSKALTDGLLGDLDFHHNWLGFEGNDMVAEIEFKKQTKVSKISLNFLKAVNSWVFLPSNIIVEVSMDGQHYYRVASVQGDNSDRNYLVKSIPFQIEFDPVEVSHLRVSAQSMKQCPDWHRGYGKACWIFVDELVVE
jgi:hypothetical protein